VTALRRARAWLRVTGRRRAWAWLRVLGGLAILGVLLWRLGTGAFLTGLSRVGPAGVAAALLIGLATTVCCAGRWVLVARRLGLRLTLPAAVAAYYRSLLLNSVLPAGVLGDVHRAVDHGRTSGDVGRGVRAVVLERAAGQVVTVAAAVTVLLARPSLVPAPYRTPVTLSGLALVALLAAAGLALLVAHRTRPAAEPANQVAGGTRPAVHPTNPVTDDNRPAVEPGRETRPAARRATGAGVTARPGGVSRWRRALAVAVADARGGLLSRRVLPGAAVLSVATYAGHLALFVVAARTAGVTAPVLTLLPLMVLALLAMGLPVNVGGWGPREGATALAFGAAGLGAAQGVEVAVVYGVLAFVAGLPGAGVLLAQALAGFRSRLRPIRPRTDGNNAMTDNVEPLPRRIAVERAVETRLPTVYGVFRAIGYLDGAGNEQVALVRGDVYRYGTLVRVHSECLTGDAFGSTHCECGDQLGAALEAIVREGAGVLVYVRGHEGRGIGLLAKLKAMRLQEDGLDTVEANLALGLPVDARDYHVAAAILHDLGAGPVRLLSNNPHKVEQLERYGIGVCEQVPLLMAPNDENIRYLRAKRERLDHYLPHLDKVTG
jgi:3,4-dihydroxy 2-butanone 4-phosphate synthase/GTP cyclohydrolase II